MKNSTSIRTAALGSLAFACAGVTFAFLLAGSSGQPAASDSCLAALSRASAPELPAVAARLVAQAPAESREATAVEVVRTVNALAQPSSLPFVVAAISESSPSVAVAAMGEASRLQPEVRSACVHAATTAAPGQAATIVAQAVKQQPTSYARLALVAAQAAPARGAEISSVMSAGLPQLQPFADRAAVGASSKPEVSSVVAQVNGMVASAAQGEIATVRSSGIATPNYVPLASSTQKGPPVITPITPAVTPTPEKTIGNTIPQSGNDRDYSAP